MKKEPKGDSRIENYSNEMENLLDRPDSIFELTEKQINKLEDWSMEIIQS